MPVLVIPPSERLIGLLLLLVCDLVVDLGLLISTVIIQEGHLVDVLESQQHRGNTQTDHYHIDPQVLSQVKSR